MFAQVPDVLRAEEVKRIREAISEATFADGKMTAGARAKRVKNNEQMAKDSPKGDAIRKAVVKALYRSQVFKRLTFPKLIQAPLISRYVPGMAYGRHIDDALMGKEKKTRTDVSVTLFLSDPGEYEGGDLVLYSGMDEKKFKLPAGTAAVYPSGALHRVAEVTKGVRFAAITWVESFVRDPYKREILADLDVAARWAVKTSPEAYETDVLQKAYSNLVRHWSDT